MDNNDTLLLLKECDAGSKMAVSSIDEVLDKVKNIELKQLLTENKKQHEQEHIIQTKKITNSTGKFIPDK